MAVLVFTQRSCAVRWLGSTVALLALLCGFSACSSAPTEAPAPSQPIPPHVASVVELGDRALARGDLSTAKERYERAISMHPNTPTAIAGLGRLALAQGETERATLLLAEAVELDPNNAHASIALAGIERSDGNLLRATQLARRAVRVAPRLPEAHRLFEALTGRATGEDLRRALSLDEVLALVDRHPYDPAVRLRAARAYLANGQSSLGMRQLIAAIERGDFDIRAARDARRMLETLPWEEEARHVVWVHIRADESVRRDPAWQMRLRLAWSEVSRVLDPLLHTIFAPLSLRACETAGSSISLVDIEWACQRGAPRPTFGMLATFTERRPPKRAGYWNLGHAQLLGRDLTVRLKPGQILNRTLVHEVMHIYGGIHIAKNVESLMNPYGGSFDIDPLNQRIVSQMRERRFGPGGIYRNVLRPVDMEPVMDAYVDMLQANLGFRQEGIAKAKRAAAHSRFWAANLGREVTQLDPHMGHIADFVGDWMARDGQEVNAASLYQAASQLLGPESPGGQSALRKLDRILETASPAID